MSKKRIILYISIFITLITINLYKCSKSNQNEIVEIDFSKKEPYLNINNGNQKHLNVAVSAMISPKETYKYYQELLNYISNKLDMPINLKQRKTYQEVNNLLKLGELDMAFICSGAYISALAENCIDLLVTPTVNNEPYYYAYIIVHKDSPFKEMSDLRGQSFAFTDILSNTGRLFPLYLLAKMGENPEQFFSKIIFTYAHDNSIHAVNKKIVAGASVDSLIFEYIKNTHPLQISNTRIIKKSPPFGIPPIVVQKNINPNTFLKLQNILIDMADNKDGKKILNKLMINRFIIPNRNIYNSLKEMKIFIEKEL